MTSNNPLSVRGILSHWITAVTAGLGSLSYALNIGVVDAVWSVVWGQLPTLFTVTSITAFTIAPELPVVPAQPLRVAAVVVGVLYVGKLGADFVDALEDKLT